MVRVEEEACCGGAKLPALLVHVREGQFAAFPAEFLQEAVKEYEFPFIILAFAGESVQERVSGVRAALHENGRVSKVPFART